jgi:hypothetical protein
MKHYIQFNFDKRQSWREYQEAELKCFGSVRGWKGEPTEAWLTGTYAGGYYKKK